MLATALPAGCFRRDAGGGFADLSNYMVPIEMKLLSEQHPPKFI